MTNKCDSISCEERKQGANEYCEKICDNSSILHACNTAVENGENNLNNKSVDSYSNKMKLSDTIEDRPQQSASSASDIVMSSISKQQITEIIDKPIIATTGGGQNDRRDKKPQCNKPLSKSDSGFSEQNVTSTMNGKDTSEVTSKIVSVDDEVPSEECEEEEDFDSCEDGEEIEKRKEMDVDQAHKHFDKRFGAQIALSSISSDLKNEFEEAGATSPLERSIKKLRRLNSVNVKESKKVVPQHENSESDDDYEDDSYSDEEDEMSQGTLTQIPRFY